MAIFIFKQVSFSEQSVWKLIHLNNSKLENICLPFYSFLLIIWNFPRSLFKNVLPPLLVNIDFAFSKWKLCTHTLMLGGGSGYRQVSLYQVTWGYILGVTSHSLHPIDLLKVLYNSYSRWHRSINTVALFVSSKNVSNSSVFFLHKNKVYNVHIQGWEFTHRFSEQIPFFKNMSDSLICSFLVSNLSDLLTVLHFGEPPERIALYKRRK